MLHQSAPSPEQKDQQHPFPELTPARLEQLDESIQAMFLGKGTKIIKMLGDKALGNGIVVAQQFLNDFLNPLRVVLFGPGGPATDSNVLVGAAITIRDANRAALAFVQDSEKNTAWDRIVCLKLFISAFEFFQKHEASLNLTPMISELKKLEEQLRQAIAAQPFNPELDNRALILFFYGNGRDGLLDKKDVTKGIEWTNKLAASAAKLKLDDNDTCILYGALFVLYSQQGNEEEAARYYGLLGSVFDTFKAKARQCKALYSDVLFSYAWKLRKTPAGSELFREIMNSPDVLDGVREKARDKLSLEKKGDNGLLDKKADLDDWIPAECSERTKSRLQKLDMAFSRFTDLTKFEKLCTEEKDNELKRAANDCLEFDAEIATTAATLSNVIRQNLKKDNMVDLRKLREPLYGIFTRAQALVEQGQMSHLAKIGIVRATLCCYEFYQNTLFRELSSETCQRTVRVQFKAPPGKKGSAANRLGQAEVPIGLTGDIETLKRWRAEVANLMAAEDQAAAKAQHPARPARIVRKVRR